MSLSSFKPLFNKKVLLLTHAGADVDSFASAAAIHFCLKGKANTSIGVPDHLNLNSKALAKKLKIPFQINPSLKGFDAIVCLDFNKPNMLGSMKESYASFSGEKFMVDHHSEEKERVATLNNSCSSKKAISTTELVYSLIKKTKDLKITPIVASCICVGIITDSSSFMICDHSTFKIMSEVMEKTGKPYSELVSLFRVPRDFSQKIAQLKAAKRCRIFKLGESIIAISEVGAFEADSASALVRLGADAAFCGYSEKNELRISGRVNNQWMLHTKIDLARDVFNLLEKSFDGEGGGHPGAAGFNGKGDNAEKVLLKCVELVKDYFSKKDKSISFKEYD